MITIQLTLPVYIGVFAYGEARFDLTFNPCLAQIYRYEIEFVMHKTY